MNVVSSQCSKIGYKLRQLRMDKGYSQEYVAEILTVSQKTYSNMENDKTSISVEVLKKIAEEYKVNFTELLSDKKVAVQHNYLVETSAMQRSIGNNVSDELVAQLKLRIEDLKNSLAEKEKHISILEKLLLK